MIGSLSEAWDARKEMKFFPTVAWRAQSTDFSLQPNLCTSRKPHENYIQWQEDADEAPLREHRQVLPPRTPPAGLTGLWRNVGGGACPPPGTGPAETDSWERSFLSTAHERSLNGEAQRPGLCTEPECECRRADTVQKRALRFNYPKDFFFKSTASTFMTRLHHEPIHLKVGNERPIYTASHKNALPTTLFLDAPILWKSLSPY